MFEEELKEIRKNFIKTNNLKCENCRNYKGKIKCSFEKKCILKNDVLLCNYSGKQKVLAINSRKNAKTLEFNSVEECAKHFKLEVEYIKHLIEIGEKYRNYYFDYEF